MTGPTGKRRYDPRARARAIRTQHPGQAPRASLRPHCDHWQLGRASRAAKLGIITKESA